MIGWGIWTKKQVDYLGSLEGKGGLNVIHFIAENAALFVDLL